MADLKIINYDLRINLIDFVLIRVFAQTEIQMLYQRRTKRLTKFDVPEGEQVGLLWKILLGVMKRRAKNDLAMNDRKAEYFVRVYTAIFQLSGPNFV